MWRKPTHSTEINPGSKAPEFYAVNRGQKQCNPKSNIMVSRHKALICSSTSSVSVMVCKRKNKPSPIWDKADITFSLENKDRVTNQMRFTYLWKVIFLGEGTELTLPLHSRNLWCLIKWLSQIFDFSIRPSLPSPYSLLRDSSGRGEENQLSDQFVFRGSIIVLLSRQR